MNETVRKVPDRTLLCVNCQHFYQHYNAAGVAVQCGQVTAEKWELTT